MVETSSSKTDGNGHVKKGFLDHVRIADIIAVLLVVSSLFGIYLGLQQQLSVQDKKYETLKIISDYQVGDLKAALVDIRELRSKVESLKQAYDYQALGIKALQDAATEDRRLQRETDRELKLRADEQIKALGEMRLIIANRGNVR